MITVPKDQIKQHLDWVKTLITICSAAIGALVYKFGSKASTPWQIKASSAFFIVSMLTLLISYTGLINHYSTYGDIMLNKSSIPLMIGWLTFLLAFGLLVLRLF